MRIIAGIHRGRTLKAPAWTGLRPTSDRLRETLFNILAPRIAGASLLDVYAGTGAVALEALSRGAVRAICIEHDRRAQEALIVENRGRVGEDARCMIVRDDALRALKGRVPGEPFDIVFLDPPYEYQELSAVLKLATAHRAEGGVVILEHASRRPSPPLAGVAPGRVVRAGDSTLAFYL